MNKGISKWIIGLVMGVMMSLVCNVTSVQAAERIEGGFEYVITDKGACIWKYVGTEKNVVIPGKLGGHTVYELSEEAFEGKEISSVHIPASVEYIGDYAFSWCTATKITFEKNSRLEAVGIYVFEGSGIEEIEMPASLKVLDGFNHCGNLKKITFEKGSLLERVERYAITTAKIEEIILPSKIQEVEYDAFLKCSDLKRIYYPATMQDKLSERTDLGVTAAPQYFVEYSVRNTSPATVDVNIVKISDDAMQIMIPMEIDGMNVASVKAADVTEVKTELSVDSTVRKMSQVKLPAGWSVCESDKNKLIPSGGSAVATIEYKRNSNSIISVSVKVNRALCKHSWDAGVITTAPKVNKAGVKTYTCKICNDTRTETISLVAPKKNTVFTDKKTKAKYKVTKSSVTNGTVEYIGTTNKNVRKVVIPATIKTADGVVFKVTSVKNGALKNKKKLREVVIGKNVKTIGKRAFYGCKNLKTITIKTTKLTNKKVGSQALKGIHKKAKIKVPKSKYKAYKKWLIKKGITSTVVIKK